MLQKEAFTLIELIFAIVIISLVVFSLPAITNTTSKSIENNIIQEAIFAASAELNTATAYYWDKRSMEDNNYSLLSRVIDINGSCENDNTSPRYRLKLGHIDQLLHRRCLNSNATTVNNTADATFPNLNNAAHVNTPIFTDSNISAFGYKNNYTSTVTITQNNNTKTLSITVFKADATPITTLKTVSANVGEIDYFKRRF